MASPSPLPSPSSPMKPNNGQNDDDGGSLKDSKKVGLEGIKKSQQTTRFKHFLFSPLCDDFLYAGSEFASAHIRIVELQKKRQVWEKKTGDPKGAEVMKRCDVELLVAQEEKEMAQETLGLKYSEVLRFNLEYKFDPGNKPFDEAAFYETMYKFVSHTVRAFKKVNPTLWKELDIELGRLFVVGISIWRNAASSQEILLAHGRLPCKRVVRTSCRMVPAYSEEKVVGEGPGNSTSTQQSHGAPRPFRCHIPTRRTS